MIISETTKDPEWSPALSVLKYFVSNRADTFQEGQILIILTQAENGLLKLHIADNGQNTAHESVLNKESGFGTLLVQLLTTQLGGKLEKSTEAGTSIMIRFPRQEKAVA